MNGSPRGPFRLRPSPRELLILGVIFGLGVWLRFAAAAGRELWLDETHSALLAGLPLPRLLAFIRGDVHPPLYFLALAAWTRLAGDAPTALRGFSILASLLTGAVAYVAVARLVRSRAAGILAAGLTLTAPVLLVYSVEVRMYALATLLATIMLACLPEPGTRWSYRAALGFAATALLACLTHYMAAFVVAGVLVWLILESRRQGGALRPVVTAGLVIALGFLPWSPVLLRQRELKQELRAVELIGTRNPDALNYGSTANATPPLATRLRSAVENAASAAGALGLKPLPLALASSLPVLVAAALVLLGGLRGAPASRLFLIVALSVAIGCVAIGATGRRFMILAVPFWIAAVAELWSSLRHSRRAFLAGALAASVTAVFLLGSGLTVREPHASPFSDTVQHLADRYREGDLVVFNASYAEIPFGYHARRAGFEPVTRGFPVNIHQWWAAQDFKGWGGPVVTEADLSTFLDEVRAAVGQGTLWLVLFETRYYDPRNRLRAELGERGTPATESFARPGIVTTGFRFPRT